MRFTAALVITFVMVSVVTVKTTDAAYKRLNEFLLEKVDTDDVHSNLEAAREWLDQQEDANCQQFTSKVPIADLERFTALKEVLNDKKCDRTAYAIMHANEKAAGIQKLYGPVVIRRVDKVILDVFVIHAMKCRKVYPLKYRMKRDQMNEKAIKHVRILTTMLMELDAPIQTRHLHYEPQNLFTQYIAKSPSISRYTGLNILQTALLYMAKDDPNVKYAQRVLDERTGKSIVHKKIIKDLVRKYLIGSCKQYVTLMGADLFVPATFDARAYNEIDNYDSLYYLSWSNFMICDAVIRNEHAVLIDVVKSVKGRY